MLRVCGQGKWQWPFRGVRIGEASHPGPPLPDMSIEEENDLFGSPTSEADCESQLPNFVDQLFAMPIDLDMDDRQKNEQIQENAYAMCLSLNAASK